ncbi:hypothetical protein D3C74_430640 [compost metagenome]
MLGAGFATVYAVNAIQKGVQETNRYQLELSQAGRNVIDSLPALQAEAFVNSLRNTLETMADKLREVHQRRIGAYDQDGYLEKIQYASRRIKKLNAIIQKQLVVQHAGLTL